MNSTHHYEQLIEIFNSCFADEFNTRLIKGDDNRSIFLLIEKCRITNRLCSWLHASAIHEISHWYCRKSAP
ncbi:elongation factor P hydroxylase [Shigella flexneri]